MSSASKKVGAAFDIKLIARIIKLAKPHRKLLWLAIVFTLLLTALAPIRPMLVQYTLDHFVEHKDKAGIQLFSIYILIHIILNSLVLFGHTYITNLLGQKVIKDLRMRVYNHILSLSSSFFDHSKVGMLITRSVSDVETVSNFFSQGFISIIGDLAQIVAVLVIMFITSWKLTLISLAVMPLLLIASEIFRRGVKSSFQKVRVQVSQLNSFVQEQIVGMEVVQVFGKEEQEFQKFEKINSEHMDAHNQSIFYYAVYFPIVEIVSSLALGLIVWWSAGYPSVASAGLITAFILYINLIFRPIRFIADRFNTMQMGVVSSERIFELLDDNTAVEKKGDVVLRDFHGDISFDNVWFAYVDEEYVLKDVSFKLEAGKSLAIVGATGAGKSSIISLITRLYTIQQGTIKIDGIEVNELEIESLRNQVAVVLQDVFLFAGTISENVTLKNSNITQERMKEAAASIGALSFIESLEGGWQYEVMERGNTLSVGQRQLISFIRAMAADPKLLILDEATSSVDSETEELIQQATQQLMKGRTSIIIAHRLSTVREVDSIMVLDKGRVVEQGNHDELMHLQGAYYELFQKQFELA
ncbi:MAG TPA: antibiotic ABC transporter ATP-binding protein [Bacteroidetes bacterium]|nr:antibiotic ABC transporter ATP-binding protein [Bacteroidota bacterium]|tara:strand:+ start:4629 stop:6383 length:1755 start_codon:yes stop_codon:yes gene_type:complete